MAAGELFGSIMPLLPARRSHGKGRKASSTRSNSELRAANGDAASSMPGADPERPPLELEADEVPSYEPFSGSESRFLQQELRGCWLHVGPWCVLGTFLVMAVAAFALGGWVIESQRGLFTGSHDYDMSGLLDFNVGQSVENLFVFYSVGGMYESNFMLIRSKSWPQLRGEVPAKMDSCEPVRGAVPCGALPSAMFTDEVKVEASSAACSLDFAVAQPSWRRVFRPLDASFGPAFVNTTGDAFANWMQIAPFPSFLKVWARLVGACGRELVLNVTSRFAADVFGGAKRVVVAEVGRFGLRQDFTGNFLLALGAVCAACAVGAGICRCARMLPIYRRGLWVESDCDLPPQVARS